MPRVHDRIDHVRIDQLRIAEPCQASWNGMAGDERVRHCTLCSLNVYNFAEMTRGEVLQLLARTEGRVCARLYRRADGTVLTRNCPVGLRALRRRASRVAAAVLAALLALPSLAFGGRTGKKPRLRVHGSKVKFQVERVTTAQLAVLDGVIRDQTGVPLPGATIVVRDEATQDEIVAITDGNGAFRIASLNAGLYRVEVMLSGFKTARVEHLSLHASEVTHATVALRVMEESITVGAIAPDSMMSSDGSVSMTFTQDLVSKLPF